MRGERLLGYGMTSYPSRSVTLCVTHITLYHRASTSSDTRVGRLSSEAWHVDQSLYQTPFYTAQIFLPHPHSQTLYLRSPTLPTQPWTSSRTQLDRWAASRASSSPRTANSSSSRAVVAASVVVSLLFPPLVSPRFSTGLLSTLSSHDESQMKRGRRATEEQQVHWITQLTPQCSAALPAAAATSATSSTRWAAAAPRARLTRTTLTRVSSGSEPEEMNQADAAPLHFNLAPMIVTSSTFAYLPFTVSCTLHSTSSLAFKLPLPSLHLPSTSSAWQLFTLLPPKHPPRPPPASPHSR